MAQRLRRVDCSSTGLRRERRGGGFAYRDADGRLVDPETRVRIAALAIPPAWQDVWICPDERGHLQATGIDDRGRKQYLYHPDWRVRRDRAKFAVMEEFAHALPDLRRTVAADLEHADLDEARVLACAVRLLDVGFFRIGSRAYAEENESYGLSTLRREHVTVRGDELWFAFTAKGGIEREQVVRDAQAAAVVRRLLRRRTGAQLLAWREGRRWTELNADQVNEYLKAVAGPSASAKVFRTWQATVLAAVALAVSAPAARSRTGRQRAKTRATQEVARYLGNTPTVARASYVDPRVFDRYDSGLTIAGALDELAADGEGIIATHGAVEHAVLDLLARDLGSDAIERVPVARPRAA